MTRTHVPALGSLVSLPDAFLAADEGVRNAVKAFFRVEHDPNSDDPVKADAVLISHMVAVDFEAVNPGAFDPEKLVRDCELLIDAAQQHPEKLRNVLAAYQAGVPHEKILEAFDDCKHMKLTEDMSVKEGGGLIWLLAIGAAVVFSGCKAHCHGNKRQTD